MEGRPGTPWPSDPARRSGLPIQPAYRFSRALRGPSERRVRALIATPVVVFVRRLRSFERPDVALPRLDPAAKALDAGVGCPLVTTDQLGRLLAGDPVWTDRDDPIRALQLGDSCRELGERDRLAAREMPAVPRPAVADVDDPNRGSGAVRGSGVIIAAVVIAAGIDVTTVDADQFGQFVGVDLAVPQGSGQRLAVSTARSSVSFRAP